MFCSECGKQIADNAKFCGECGTAQISLEQTPEIEVEQIANKATATANDVPSSGNINVTTYVVGTIIVISLGFYLLNHFATDKTESTEEMRLLAEYEARVQANGKIVDDARARNKAAEALEPQSTLSNSSSSHSKINLNEGTKYNYFSDGSCKENCLTKEQAESVCKSVSGVTSKAIRLLSILANNETKALLEGGSLSSFNANWTGNSCYATVIMSGIYKGSSTRVNVSGKANSFLKSNGEILVDYIDNF